MSSNLAQKMKTVPPPAVYNNKIYKTYSYKATRKNNYDKAINEKS